MTEIKEKLKTIRNRYSQRTLAKRLGVTEQFVSQILNGKRPIPKKYRRVINSFINFNR